MGHGKADSAFRQTKRPYCPFKNFCIFLRGENPAGVLEQRDYLSKRVDELEFSADLANHQYKKLLAYCQELEGKNSHLEKELAQALKDPFDKYKPGEEVPNSKKRGAPTGHPGWFRKKPEQIDKTVDVYLEVCPLCGSGTISPCNHTTEHVQEDIENGKVLATCFVHCYYWCGDCKQVVHGWGENEIPNAFIGARARAAAIFLRHEIKVSYDDVQRTLQYLCGLVVVPGSLVGFDNKFADKAEPVYEDIKESLHATWFLNIDETGWNQDWMWIFTEPKTAFFRIDESRGSQVIIDTLGEYYNGIIISDFWSAYRDKVSAFAKQKCIAHLLRDIIKLLKDETIGVTAKNFLNELKILFKDAISLHNIHPSLSDSEYRREKKDIHKRFRKLQKHPELTHHDTDNIRKRLITFSDELLVFLKYPAISPTNNAAERGIRNAVLFRKITFGNMTKRGKRNVAVTMTIIRTAMLRKLEPIGLLREIMLHNAPLMPEAP